MSALKILTAIAIAIVISMTGQADTAAAGNIYNSNVERKLKLNGAQRSKVVRIVRKSRRQRNVIFRKHGINPNARPDFDKLYNASTELRALQRNERKQLSKVLSRDQLKHYDAIINQTRARVRKAAQ